MRVVSDNMKASLRFLCLKVAGTFESPVYGTDIRHNETSRL